MESKRKEYEPTTAAQYYESISDCLSYNSVIEQQRSYARKRRTLVQTEGYEAVLNRSKRAQLAFSPYPNMPMSNVGLMPSATSMHPAPLKPPVAGQTTAVPPKLQQNILPMNDAMSKQLAPKPVKPSATPQPSTQPVHLKPLGDTPTIFAVGSDVIVHQTEKLTAYGLGHLRGRKGTVVSVPAGKGQFLYGVMFDNTMHHVPLESLVSADAAAAQMKLPASSQLKLEQSFHMHRLMQDQFKEIQALQNKHAEHRVANNSAAMAEVQKSLAVLRNLHLTQIRALKAKHDEELRQKELT